MKMNKQLVVQNSQKVYRVMQQLCRTTYNELQRLTRLDCVELCMALVVLLREGKVRQYRDESGICYVLASPGPIPSGPLVHPKGGEA